jgi:ketosteroid isomerase-like protein
MTAADIVSSIYRAFGEGDTATVLGHLDEHVSWDADWADHSAHRAGVPHFAPRHGHDGVAEFFALVGKGAIHEFVVHDLMSSDRQVVAQVTIDWTLPSGGRLRDEELHLWTFGRDGRVVALRHYVDTAKHIRADAGEDTTVRT